MFAISMLVTRCGQPESVASAGGGDWILGTPNQRRNLGELDRRDGQSRAGDGAWRGTSGRELARLRRENAVLVMEHDVLKRLVTRTAKRWHGPRRLRDRAVGWRAARVTAPPFQAQGSLRDRCATPGAPRHLQATPRAGPSPRARGAPFSSQDHINQESPRSQGIHRWRKWWWMATLPCSGRFDSGDQAVRRARRGR